jgi:hypothetical protein
LLRSESFFGNAQHAVVCVNNQLAMTTGRDNRNGEQTLTNKCGERKSGGCPRFVPGQDGHSNNSDRSARLGPTKNLGHGKSSIQNEPQSRTLAREDTVPQLATY